MKKIIYLCAFALIYTSFSHAATLQSMNKTQATKALENKTITTVPMVTIDNKLIDNNSVTVYFGKDNEVIGKFATKPENNPQDDKGTWMVKDSGTVCVTWKQWEHNTPICINVYKTSNSLVFINADTNKFESMVLLNNIKTGNTL